MTGKYKNVRSVGLIFPVEDDADFYVEVVHVYDNDQDAGEVGLSVGGFDEEGNEGSHASLTMNAQEALELANRLQRAAAMVLEALEDPSESSREFYMSTRDKPSRG